MVCGNPGKVEHGSIEGGNFNYNDQVNYKCDKGYKLYGGRQRTCLESGNWSGYAPKCKRINTSKYLYNIIGGNVFLSQIDHLAAAIAS